LASISELLGLSTYLTAAKLHINAFKKSTFKIKSRYGLEDFKVDETSTNQIVSNHACKIVEEFFSARNIES